MIERGKEETVRSIMSYCNSNNYGVKSRYILFRGKKAWGLDLETGPELAQSAILPSPLCITDQFILGI